MIYILKNASGHILSYGETPWALSEGQTQDALDTSMNEFAARFRLSADKTTIDADGEDEAIVTVHTSLYVPSIDLLVNGVPVTVAIVDGAGQLDPITAETSGVVLVEPANKALYCVAGGGSVLINAVEV